MKSSFIILLINIAITLNSQTASWTQLCALDQKMIHSSGLVTLNSGKTFWTQVDNNSPAEIYEINTNCEILRTVSITNVSKTDWEEITSDDQGNIYLGDFGNNLNNRKNLSIYILRNIENAIGDSITPDVIKFNYANQTAFPPPATHRNFDMEAMVWHSDSLHLFSKNRTDPFTGYTYQYVIPANEGEYHPEPLDSFKTGDGPMVFYWITASALNDAHDQLILLSHDRLWLFYNFPEGKFFQGNSKMITLPSYTQKEAITYANENTWFLTDEYFPTLGLGGNLYKMKLNELTAVDEEQDIEFKIYPNPVHHLLHILINDNSGEKEVLIYDYMGKLCKNYVINTLRTTISLEDLNAGIYVVKTFSNKWRKYISRKIIVID